jgi:glyoxylase-like metal-dependent hydrolase (beta-lactamase superfamily II)
MRVHHLNCVSACPLGGLLIDGVSTSLRGRLASHCLLIETADSLVLVDTGYGLRDIRQPRTRLNPLFLALMKPELREEMSAVRQIEALGFSARDVRHIVLSHLDFDHAGGLDDFPEATVHLLQAEAEAAEAQKTVLDRMRYRPQQWSTRAAWRTYAGSSGDRWRGFDSVRSLDGLPPEILLVPLVGHTLGHAGVAIYHESRWLFYVADAYFYHAEMRREPSCTPGLRLYQTLMEKDRPQRLANQARLRALVQAHDDITVFCAHDVRELENLSQRDSHRPLRALSAPARHAVGSPNSPARSQLA